MLLIVVPALSFLPDSLPPLPAGADTSGYAEARARDRALLLRLREGDTDALSALIDAHIDRVNRLAIYILGSPDAAEDVIQSVFVQLWEQRHTIDPEPALAPYLLRLVRNRALNERKSDAVRARHRDRVQGEAVAGSIATSAPSPESAILASTAVETALAQLSDRRQLVLRLWLKEELTPAQIAHVLGTSLQATDRLMRRALGELREILLVSK